MLIAEGCTHHRQCEDIGTVKLPKWIEEFSGRKLNFRFTSGNSFPESLSGTALAVHCGGCMLNEREMKYRQKCADDQRSFDEYDGEVCYVKFYRSCKRLRQRRGKPVYESAEQQLLFVGGVIIQNDFVGKRQRTVLFLRL